MKEYRLNQYRIIIAAMGVVILAMIAVFVSQPSSPAIPKGFWYNTEYWTIQTVRHSESQLLPGENGCESRWHAEECSLGYTDCPKHQIVLLADMPRSTTQTTLRHELGHVFTDCYVVGHDEDTDHFINALIEGFETSLRLDERNATVRRYLEER